jgi:hypothetical protein
MPFLSLRSFARRVLASFAAFFSILAFSFASFAVSGSSSELSSSAVSFIEGGNLADFRLAIGASESESLSLAFVFRRLD